MSSSNFNPEYFFPTLITNITSLNGGQFGVVKGTDVYPAVDVTDVTQSPTGTTKPYQILQLANFILDQFGFDVYLPVYAAATGNLNATYNNGLSGVGATLTNAGAMTAFVLDGIPGVLNQRYLIGNQTNQTQNGIYILSVVGDNATNWVLTRSVDFNQPANIIDGGIVYVIFGNTYANTYWQDTFIPPVVVGTSNIVWDEFSIVPNEMIWTDVTTVSINAAVNNGYIADRASTPVSILLPPTFNIGDTVIVLGKGASGWSLVANTGQNIQFGSVSTSVDGAINSDIQYGNIQVRGLIPDTVWEVTSVLGNPQII
jgi:hypothetical protein